MSFPSPDGFGIGWYEDGYAQLERWLYPIWEHTSVTEIRARAFIASARAATPGGPIEPASTAPFVSGPYLFSLNGFVDGYRTGNDARMTSMTTRKRRAEIEGDVDSTVVFALLLDQLDAKVSMREALTNVHWIVRAVSKAPFNMLLTNGRQMAATCSGHSLWLRADADSLTLSSEPLDDDDSWMPVPEESVIEGTADSHTITPLDSVLAEKESLCALPATPLIGAD